MDNINNNSYKIARSALVGGGIGACIGAAKAPSILGKVDADKFIQSSAYNSVIKDKINKVGLNLRKEADNVISACHDCFVESKNISDGISLFGEKSFVNVKGVKEACSKSPFSNAEEWAENLGEKISEFSDDVLLRRNTLDEFVITSNPKYQKVKDEFVQFVDKLPKQRGKYAAIGAGIGATVLALYSVYRIGKTATKQN